MDQLQLIERHEQACLTAWERRTIFSCLENLAARLPYPSPAARVLLQWLADHLELFTDSGNLGVRLCELVERNGIRPERRDKGDSSRQQPPRAKPPALLSPADWRRLLHCLETGRRIGESALPDHIGQMAADLEVRLGLEEIDTRILDLLLRYESQPVMQSLVDQLLTRGRRTRWRDFGSLDHWLLPALLGVPSTAVRRRFQTGAPMIDSGLVSVDEHRTVEVLERLCRVAATFDGETDTRRLLLGSEHKAELDWSDFEHLGQARDDIAAILRGALDRGAKGVNVFLYGPPGTGKTTFCHTLAAQLEVELFAIGESNESGDEPSRTQRLGELRLAQRLLSSAGGSLLLFDEMDDLLAPSLGRLFRRPPGRRNSAGESKIFLNRLLEETAAPTFWVTNSGDHIDRAILRRMTFALEISRPPAEVRARVWTRQLGRHGVDASKEEVQRLARDFAVAPGIAASASRAASLGGGDLDLARRGASSLIEALGEAPVREQPGGTAFDLQLIESDTDLGHLVDRLVAGGSLRFSLCLTGPPGTGKSAFARHLADRLGIEAEQKRTSDLLDRYVGSSEKNIARAFRQAAREGKLLIFDEADSLLSDRRTAHRQWEVSQVNEMLTWMESHPSPFVCTTNLAERLDPATLRRFVFKATLGYLKPALAGNAFRRFFDLEPPAGLCALVTLTPGDFAVVERRAKVLGVADDPNELLAMLGSECRAKPGGGSRSVGFRH